MAMIADSGPSGNSNSKTHSDGADSRNGMELRLSQRGRVGFRLLLGCRLSVDASHSGKAKGGVGVSSSHALWDNGFKFMLKALSPSP